MNISYKVVMNAFQNDALCQYTVAQSLTPELAEHLSKALTRLCRTIPMMFGDIHLLPTLMQDESTYELFAQSLQEEVTIPDIQTKLILDKIREIGNLPGVNIDGATFSVKQE